MLHARLRLFVVLAFVVVYACGESDAIAQKNQAIESKFKPIPRETVLGTVFLVRPAWDEAIHHTVERVREIVREERGSGKTICYISTPLSSRGGGHRPTNVEISRYVKRRVESRYGPRHFWALAPGVVENELAEIEGERPGGGEYLYMWTQILAGEEGDGVDFDMVYFVGPRDVHAFFGIGEGGIMESLDAYITQRAEDDVEFRQSVANVPESRSNFIRYYGIRASATFSTGALDVWNIFRLVNRRRSIGEQVAFYFDGWQVTPAASEAPVRSGYEQRQQRR